MKVRKAVIPVAGAGSRMLPISKAVPKELLPILDKPALQYIIEELVASGIDEIILVNNPSKTAILDHFNPEFIIDGILNPNAIEKNLSELNSLSKKFTLKSTMQNQPRGLGHAIYMAKELVGQNPFIVVLPDDIIVHETPATLQHLKAFETTGNSIIALLEVSKKQTPLYGIAEGERVFIANENLDLYKITSLIEKPPQGTTNSTAAIIGRYILSPKIFSYIEATKPGRGGEIQITDALIGYMKDFPLFGLFFHGIRYDIGDKLGFIKANIAFSLKDPRFKDEIKKYIKELNT